MTMSRVPKFCARRWSQIPKLSYHNPIYRLKLGINEPWPECQSFIFLTHLFQIIFTFLWICPFSYAQYHNDLTRHTLKLVSPGGLRPPPPHGMVMLGAAGSAPPPMVWARGSAAPAPRMQFIQKWTDWRSIYGVFVTEMGWLMVHIWIFFQKWTDWRSIYGLSTNKYGPYGPYNIF